MIVICNTSVLNVTVKKLLLIKPPPLIAAGEEMALAGQLLKPKLELELYNLDKPASGSERNYKLQAPKYK